MIERNFVDGDGIVECVNLDAVNFFAVNLFAVFVDGIAIYEVFGAMRVVNEIYFARIGNGFDVSIALAVGSPIARRTPLKPFQYAAR